MATGNWKVFRDKEYVAACKYAEDAACLVAACGGQVRFGHSLVVWREGSEEFTAGNSYDAAARIMEKRRYDHAIQRIRKQHGGVVPAHLAAYLNIPA